MNHQVRMLVENILRNPEGNGWQVQGLGMLRCYLDEAKRFRLHIWDNALRVPGVSAIHNHPWDLKSTVIAGCYKQHRYVTGGTERFEYLKKWGAPEAYNQVTIKCGEEAAVVAEPTKVLMFEEPLEVYIGRVAGAVTQLDDYTQKANEIHLSLPSDGTVTLVERTVPEGKDPDHACVYWRGKGPWVNAKPRPATETELYSVTKRALAYWF